MWSAAWEIGNSVDAPLRGGQKEQKVQRENFNGRERIQNTTEVQRAEQLEIFINGRDMEGEIEI